jgi:hypothetical protein
MHRDAFNSLSLDEKADFVFQKDSFIDTREYYGQTISLYLVNGFYVEVWYLPNENKILDISLPTAAQLSLYKSPVNLKGLF